MAFSSFFQSTVIISAMSQGPLKLFATILYLTPFCHFNTVKMKATPKCVSVFWGATSVLQKVFTVNTATTWCKQDQFNKPDGSEKESQCGMEKKSDMILPCLFSQEVFIPSSKPVSFWDATLIIIKKHSEMFYLNIQCSDMPQEDSPTIAGACISTTPAGTLPVVLSQIYPSIIRADPRLCKIKQLKPVFIYMLKAEQKAEARGYKRITLLGAGW